MHPRIGNVAWHFENSGDALKAVATREPNAFVLYDMLGNSLELCRDVYEAGKSHRVVWNTSGKWIMRGGSSFDFKTSFRFGMRFSGDTFGLRLVLRKR